MADTPAMEHLASPGTTVEYSTNGTLWTALVDVISVQPPPIEWGESDDTHLLSPQAIAESSAGWGVPGDSTLDVYLTKAQEAALRLLAYGRDVLHWRVTYPPLSTEAAGTKITFKAWIKGLAPSSGEKLNDDKYHTEWTLHMTGPETLTPGTAALSEPAAVEVPE